MSDAFYHPRRPNNENAIPASAPPIIITQYGAVIEGSPALWHYHPPAGYSPGFWHSQAAASVSVRAPEETPVDLSYAPETIRPSIR